MERKIDERIAFVDQQNRDRPRQQAAEQTLEEKEHDEKTKEKQN